jgi:hypothetical protein
MCRKYNFNATVGTTTDTVDNVIENLKGHLKNW